MVTYSMLIERFPQRLCDINRNEHRAIIERLNSFSEKIGCAVFGDMNQNDSATVIFAGNLERFLMLAAARQVRSKVIYF